MVVYIAITYGGIVIFLFRGVFVYLPNQSIGQSHIVCCCALMLSSLGSFLSLLVADPGRVTKKRIPGLLKRYKYDKQFYGKSECKTCRLARYKRLGDWIECRDRSIAACATCVWRSRTTIAFG